MKFCTMTLGCKVNQFETQAMESLLISHGNTPLRLGEGCDVCIVNTCAVTSESERKSRQAVRRVRKLEPDALIAVCGCLSQMAASEMKQLGADFIGGTGDRQGFVSEIERMAAGQRTVPCLTDDPAQRSVIEDLPPGGGRTRTRALLKIQDGCSNYCSYCIVPYVRGSVRSLTLERAAALASMLQEKGIREIVVTGIEISSYGKDLKKTDTSAPSLIEAVRGICEAAPNARVRLGSLDPGALREEFLRELSMLGNLCPHFHLSLQSGCDDTLRRMGRKYSTKDVLKAVETLRDLFPDCGITADLIVGFPGETDKEFHQTLEFIKSAAFSDMHIFPYSPRPGTRAADMPEQIEKKVKQGRAGIAAAAAERMALDFRAGQIGKTAEVLFERKRDGFWTGHTGNYLEVSVTEGGEKNSVRSVKITDIKDRTLWGDIVAG